MTAPKLRVICNDCSSPRIEAFGWCEWDTELQAWHMDEVHSVICRDCECPSNEYTSEEIKDGTT